MPLPRRTEVHDAIVTEIDYTITTHGSPPFLIHSDNAKEYLSAVF